MDCAVVLHDSQILSSGPEIDDGPVVAEANEPTAKRARKGSIAVTLSE